MQNNAGSYNILDDDKYADVFIDLEGNKSESKSNEEDSKDASNESSGENIKIDGADFL